MSRRGFGPAHDRIDLTDDEIQVIGRLEHDLQLAAGSEPAAGSPAGRAPLLRLRLGPRAHAYYLCMRYRRAAIVLMPVAGVALAVAVTASLALATLCAAVWTIGFAALLTEVGAAFRRVKGGHAGRAWEHSDPNAADGGR